MKYRVLKEMQGFIVGEECNITSIELIVICDGHKSILDVNGLIACGWLEEVKEESLLCKIMNSRSYMIEPSAREIAKIARDHCLAILEHTEQNLVAASFIDFRDALSEGIK